MLHSKHLCLTCIASQMNDDKVEYLFDRDHLSLLAAVSQNLQLLRLPQPTPFLTSKLALLRPAPRLGTTHIKKKHSTPSFHGFEGS